MTTDFLRTKTVAKVIPLLLLIGLCFLSITIIKDYLIPIIWAIIIAYVLWPAYQILRQQLNNKDNLSAAMMTGLIGVFISLTVYWLIDLIQIEFSTAYQSIINGFNPEKYQLHNILAKLPWLNTSIKTWIAKLHIDENQLLSQLSILVKQGLGQFTQAIDHISKNALKLGAFSVTLFFCFRDGELFIQQLQQGLLKFLGPYQAVCIQATQDTTRAVVCGLVLAALGQGIVAGIGYYFAGVSAPALFGALTALLAIIPMGAILVWLPISVGLILLDQTWPGVGLLLWGFCVISTIDNVIRPLVISGSSSTPILIVLLGILGGLNAFGVIGLFLGPIILAVLLAVWKTWVAQQIASSPNQEGINSPVWHELSGAEALVILDSNLDTGLSTQTVNQRIKEYGLNQLLEKPSRSKLSLFIAQFKSVLILILLAAAVLAASIGDLKDGMVILVVVIINALLGFYQEHKAEASLSALKQMLTHQSKVRRAGLIYELASAQLVPGDIVILEAGSKIPADGRILVAHTLEVDESSLTGESCPIPKHNKPLNKSPCVLAERHNMLYMNNTITRGRAEMLVTATGISTEIGQLAQLLTSTAYPTPNSTR